MLAAARQSALHSTESATTALLEESSATTASSANVLRAATGEQLVTVGTALGAGVGASARLAVAEGLTAVGRAQAGQFHPSFFRCCITAERSSHADLITFSFFGFSGGASLASQSILATEETLATLRGDISNAFQAGFEDVLDVSPSHPRCISVLRRENLASDPCVVASQTNPNLNPGSVTEQVKDLLPTFQSTAANVTSAS